MLARSEISDSPDEPHVPSFSNNFSTTDRIPPAKPGSTTYRNGPKRAGRDLVNTDTDFYEYRNGPERTLVGTETDRSRLQLIPKQTSMRTRKGRVRHDRNNPNLGR